MLKNDGKLAFTKQPKSDKNMKHGLHLKKKKAGGGGWGGSPPICKQNDLHNSRKLGWPHKTKAGGSVGIMERNEMI